MMKADEVIESYVRAVARQLPRDKRNDVAFELRALLGDELAARAQAEGRAPDKAMAMALLKGFGRPAEAARRYHERPALIDPADTHHFVIWALAGVVFLAVTAALGIRSVADGKDPLLQWLGVLMLVFALLGWWRRRHPDALGWRPTRGPDAMSRPIALLALAATLAFPVFMYAAPQAFVRVAFLGTLPSDGVVLTEQFAHSGLRMATLALLVVQAAVYAAVAVLGRWQAWVRWTYVASNLCLGILLAIHAAVLPGAHAFAIFELPAANVVARPIFAAVAALVVLGALYGAYLEWTRIRPAPTLVGGQ